MNVIVNNVNVGLGCPRRFVFERQIKNFEFRRCLSRLKGKCNPMNT